MYEFLRTPTLHEEEVIEFLRDLGLRDVSETGPSLGTALWAVQNNAAWNYANEEVWPSTPSVVRLNVARDIRLEGDGCVVSWDRTDYYAISRAEREALLVRTGRRVGINAGDAYQRNLFVLGKQETEPRQRAQRLFRLVGTRFHVEKGDPYPLER